MGKKVDPQSLHKYLYTENDPVNNYDPSGQFLVMAVIRSAMQSALLNVARTSVNFGAGAFGKSGGGGSRVGLGAASILALASRKSAIKFLRLFGKKVKRNGNSKKSLKRNHLYKITDTNIDDIWKYGISGVRLNKNGTSKRANVQANKLNKPLSYKRYVPTVIFKRIPGRFIALIVEKAFVCNYGRKNGRNPYGNILPVYR